MYSSILAKRHSLFFEFLKSRKADVFYSEYQPYINYFTDAIDVPGSLLVTNDKVLLITDSRFIEEAGALSKSVDVVISKIRAADYLKQSKLLTKKSIGLDFSNTSLQLYTSLGGSTSANKIVDVGRDAQAFLNKHDELSLKRMQKAIQISRKVLSETVAGLETGVSEIDIALDISAKHRKYGADGDAFPPVVAFNKNSSKPHCQPSAVKLKENSLVLIDLGCRYKGVNCDFTRTFPFGMLNSEKIQVIEDIRKLSLSIGKTLVPNSIASLYDSAARDILSKKALDSYFVHSLGHGVGYEIHAFPRVAPISQEMLKKNMVVTIEPGVYFQNKFGVRHEDMYLVTQDNSKNLTKF